MKLCQVIAIEKSTKQKSYGAVTEIHKRSSHPELFEGLHKTYRPKDEDGERFPDDTKKVQQRAADNLTEVLEALTEIWDITATKDCANAITTAKVKVDDNVIVDDVPPTYLLYLEKQLNDLKTFISNLPILSDAETWNADGLSGLYKTGPIETHRTKKEQRPIVLYDATTEHPAQTQLITEDVVVGYWTTVKHSGALTREQRRDYLNKISALQKAVKCAREEANGLEVEDRKVARSIIDFIMS